MRNSQFRRNLVVIFFSSLFFIGTEACTSNKRITYFQDIPDSSQLSNFDIKLANYQEPKIRSNDLLQVSIHTLDPQTNTNIGASITSTGQQQLPSGSTSNISGFLVDNNGYIELPLVGRIMVGNMTTIEAREAIRQKAAVYYKNPVVNVRFANFTITVIGEVAKPSTYLIQSEKVSVLDALGLAGDLTIYGKRENVLLIREENGVKKMARFNLNSANIFKSDYFYLRQGDLIYVEPNKAKVATNDMAQIRNVTIITASLSLLSVLLSRVNF